MRAAEVNVRLRSGDDVIGKVPVGVTSADALKLLGYDSRHDRLTKSLQGPALDPTDKVPAQSLRLEPRGLRGGMIVPPAPQPAPKPPPRKPLRHFRASPTLQQPEGAPSRRAAPRPVCAHIPLVLDGRVEQEAPPRPGREQPGLGGRAARAGKSARR